MSPTDPNGEVEVLVRITQIGCGISIVCLIACVVVFTACRRLRGISNTIHRNLCLSLLIAEILLLVGMKKNDDNEVRCTIMAFSLHFLFLSAFGWMALEGCHIIVLLWKVFNQRRSYYERYYLAGYGIPLMIASITLGSQYHSYSPKSGAYCWLPEEKGMRYSFIGPVAAVIFLNLGALLLVLWKMSQTQLLVDKSTAEKVKSWLRGTFILLPILGITWLLGFLMLGSNSLYKTGAYIFTIFNSFQGLGIFVCHVLLNQKTRREVLKTFSSMLSNSESFRSTGLSSTSTTNTELFTSSSSNLTTTRRIRQGRERFLQTLEELGNVSRPRRWWQGAFRYNLKVSDANDRST
ncbi:adhesion G protein-coupled receptor L1-like isoform X1 [Haemaphysalis longicornis]